jgi:hypothetical protein
LLADARDSGVPFGYLTTTTTLLAVLTVFAAARRRKLEVDVDG